MTEQELTALAKDWLSRPGTGGIIGAIGALSHGYLALLAERDALKAQLDLDSKRIRSPLDHRLMVRWLIND